MPVGPTILCPVKATRSAPRLATSTGSWGTACEASSTSVAPTACAIVAISRTGLTVPSTLDTYATETILVRSLTRPSRAAAARSSRPSSVTSNQRSTAPVRCASSCHGTRLEWCSITEMTISSPGRSAGAQRVGAQVERLGGVLGEDDLLRARRADELRQRGPRLLERLGRLGAEQVHGPGDVGVVVQVVVLDRLDHHPRLLRGVGAVQVDQRPVAGRALQDREVRADGSTSNGTASATGSISSTSATETVAGYSAWVVMRTTRLLPLSDSGRSPRPRAGRPAPGHPARPPGRPRRRARSRG